MRDGVKRNVDLGAPKPVRRKGRWMVQLIDLWVASGLPGDLLDLTFEIVTLGPGGEVGCSAPLGPTELARGYVSLAKRELWWDDQVGSTLDGLCVHTIVVCGAAAPASRVAPPEAPEKGGVSTVDLRRLLPHMAVRYPIVQWRVAQADESVRRAG